MENFGIIEKYQYLRKHAWCGLWSQRILSQLYYLIEASRVNGNAFAELLEEAVDSLYCHVREKGAIEKETALALEQKLMPMAELAKKYRVILVGHAHIDMNWKWGFQETVSITVDTFETILKLMEEYPQFHFSQSQGAVYQILEAYKPELLARVKEKIHEGRWEVTASTWVENDKNMSGSESHARHILNTRKYLSDLLDIPMESLELDFEPDTFGHPETMPELFRQGGIRYYYHCRGNDQNYAYVWRSPSGAEVLTYREPIWYNDRYGDYDCLGFVPEFCRMYGMTTAMKVYGVGDHGGGPTRVQLNHLQEMQSWPLMPRMQFGFIREFFAELDKVRGNLPVVQRELNYVYTGCYTTEARIKRANKLGEDRLFEAELMDAMAHSTLEQYQTPTAFGKAWENILFNQFHDILPGSGVMDTTCHALGQFQQSMATTQVNMKDAMTKLCARMDTSCFGECGEPDGPIGAGVGYGTDDITGYIVSQVDRTCSKRRVFTVFNLTQYARKEPVKLPIWDWDGNADLLYAVDMDGREHECQFLKEADYWAHHYHLILVDVEVPPMGYATFVLQERKQEQLSRDWSYFRACGNMANPPVVDYMTDEPVVLENELVKAQFSPDTLKLLSFVDKKTGQELIRTPSCGFRMITENTHQRMLAWRVGTYMKIEDLSESRPVRYLGSATGSLRQSLQYEMSFAQSNMKVTVSLDRGSTLLEFEIQVSWHEIGSEAAGIPQLNFTVPLGYRAPSYLCNIPMGVIQREELAQDVPCVGFMAGIPQEGEQGIAVLSDCKYGFRGSEDSISVALIRSSFNPDTTPDQGEHTIRIGVGIVKTQPAEVDRMFAGFVHPLSTCATQIHGGSLPAGDTWLQLSGNARIQSIKRAEDGNGIIVRLHNLEKAPQPVCLSCKQPVTKAALTDISESKETALAVENGACAFTLDAGALRSVRLVLEK